MNNVKIMCNSQTLIDALSHDAKKAKCFHYINYVILPLDYAICHKSFLHCIFYLFDNNKRTYRALFLKFFTYHFKTYKGVLIRCKYVCKCDTYHCTRMSLSPESHACSYLDFHSSHFSLTTV